ncbi:MAG: hypothetical protein PWQ82_1292 [Thermosediminibacterales bacterium]|nr:hypothetical protein [Thermosediminibacterales bacterium]MDK2836512.1 hypothetical protein [Thermosediminibacterales bacterium]
MAFTFTAVADPAVTDNSLDSANVDITVSPTSGVISESNMLPGDSTQGVVNVSNTGDVDCYYFISADWKAGGTTTASKAALLANKLAVSVSSGATSLYTGTLANLIDKPDSPGRQLTLATGNEDVTISISLPSTAGSIYQNIDVDVDFLFVATQ